MGQRIIMFYKNIFKTAGNVFVIALSLNVYAWNNGHKEYYISPSGSDKNNGSINSPFATIEKARNLIREDKQKFPETSYTVYFREGIYSISKTMEFDKRDIAI